VAGSYLAACVFLAKLFKVDPIGIKAGAPALDESGRELLQRVAWKECNQRG
jgi:hypothetical protein